MAVTRDMSTGSDLSMKSDILFTAPTPRLITSAKLFIISPTAQQNNIFDAAADIFPLNMLLENFSSTADMAAIPKRIAARFICDFSAAIKSANTAFMNPSKDITASPAISFFMYSVILPLAEVMLSKNSLSDMNLCHGARSMLSSDSSITDVISTVSPSSYARHLIGITASAKSAKNNITVFFICFIRL